MELNFPRPWPVIGKDWRCACGAGPWRKNERGVNAGNIANVPGRGVMCLACAGIEPGTTGIYDTPRRSVLEP